MAARQICRKFVGLTKGGYAAVSHGMQAFGARVVPALLAVLFRAICSVFKRQPGYFPKATAPCAVAYGYARIRRLVRPGAAR